MLYGTHHTAKLDDGQQLPGYRYSTPNKSKVAIVRLPTSDEMCSRIDGQRTIRRNLGRGQVESDTIHNDKADLALFEAIRVAGDDFDAFEARAAIAALTDVDVIGHEREGDKFIISLRTPFGVVTHSVRIPSDKDLFTYRRGVVSVRELRNSQEELRYRSSAGVDLYDSTAPKTEGYDEEYLKKHGVPAHHKFAVAGELSTACSIEGQFDPNS